MQNATPEDMKEGMEAWMVWAKAWGDGLVEFGTPLGGGQKLTKSGSSPSDKGVVGYSILQAEDMEATTALLKNHPHTDWGGAMSRFTSLCRCPEARLVPRQATDAIRGGFASLGSAFHVR